ncbi:MAG: hypothetical protein ACP5L2_02990 [Conexivisphaera sp.]
MALPEGEREIPDATARAASSSMARSGSTWRPSRILSSTAAASER